MRFNSLRSTARTVANSTSSNSTKRYQRHGYRQLLVTMSVAGTDDETLLLWRWTTSTAGGSAFSKRSRSSRPSQFISLRERHLSVSIMRAAFVDILHVAAAAMAVTPPGAWADCGATFKQLTWECGGLCGDNVPCVAYDVSANCSSCVVDNMEECRYLCLSSTTTRLELENYFIAAFDMNLTVVFPNLERL